MYGDKGYILNIVETFDNAVYAFISGFISDSTTKLMKFITFFGSARAFIVIILGMLTYSLISTAESGNIKPGRKSIFKLSWNKGTYYCLLVTINLLAGSLFNFILKQLFRRPRPELLKMIEIGGYSFPSGHSMASFNFMALLHTFA